MNLEEKLFDQDGNPYEKYREKARNDFGWFTYWILGYRDLGKFHIEEAIPIFEYVVGDFPKVKETPDGKYEIHKFNELRVLYLLPRGTFKSTLFTIAASIWFIIRNPEVKIGLGSWKIEIAEGFLGEIKSHLEENDILKKMFPEIFYDDPKKSDKWSTQKIKVFRFGKAKEHTIECFGIENQPTSRHYDIILLDDVVNETNVTSKQLIKKTKEKLGLLNSLLVNPSEDPIFMVGTRYHFDDAYGDYEENDEWFTYKRPIVNPDGSYLFPERFDEKGLEKIRKFVGNNYVFSCQYLLSPIHPDDQEFDIKELNYYTKLPNGLEFYGGSDTALSTGKRADNSAFVVIGYDPTTAKIYLVDAEWGKFDLQTQIDIIIQLAKKYNFAKFNIEGIGAIGQLIEPALKKELFAHNVQLNYEIVKGYARSMTGGNSKNEKPRIPIVIQPHMNNGNLYIPKKMRRFGGANGYNDLVEVLKDELAKYPMGQHDDLLDGLVLALLGVPSFVPIEKRGENSTTRRVRREEEEYNENLFVSAT